MNKEELNIWIAENLFGEELIIEEYEYHIGTAGRKQELPDYECPEGEGWEEYDHDRDSYTDTYHFRRKLKEPIIKPPRTFF